MTTSDPKTITTLPADAPAPCLAAGRARPPRGARGSLGAPAPFAGWPTHAVAAWRPRRRGAGRGCAARRRLSEVAGLQIGPADLRRERWTVIVVAIYGWSSWRSSGGRRRTRSMPCGRASDATTPVRGVRAGGWRGPDLAAGAQSCWRSPRLTVGILCSWPSTCSCRATRRAGATFLPGSPREPRWSVLMGWTRRSAGRDCDWSPDHPAGARALEPAVTREKVEVNVFDITDLLPFGTHRADARITRPRRAASSSS